MKGVKNYLKNVTKSTIYYASDIAKEELMPNVGDFATTNADFIKAAYSTLRNPKTVVKKVLRPILKLSILSRFSSSSACFCNNCFFINCI